MICLFYMSIFSAGFFMGYFYMVITGYTVIEYGNTAMNRPVDVIFFVF